MMQHLPVLSIIVLFLGAFLTAIIGRNKILRTIIVCAATSISFIFIILLVKPVLIQGNIITYWMGDWSPEMGYAIGIGLEVDGLNLLFGIITSLTTLISAIYSFEYMKRDGSLDKYYLLFLMLSGSVLAVLFTGDLFNMFVMLTLMTFASIGLTAFKNKSDGALRAALQLLIIDGLALALMLLGTVMLYAQFHTLSMAQIAAMLHNNFTPVTLFSFALLIGGFGVKAYMAASHSTVPDALKEAPSPISILFSGMVNMAGVYGMIRLLFIVYTSMNLPQMRLMFVIWGTAVMFLGAILAFGQADLKKFLAFQVISQTGYVFVGVGLSTVSGVTAGLYHVINQTFFMGLLFLCGGAVLNSTGTTDLKRLGGLSKKMPHTALLFIIGALSISGLPPFNGFITKSLIFHSAFASGYGMTAIIALITSLITIASFIKVSKGVFFGQLHCESENAAEAPLLMKISMWIMAVLCLALGIIPQYISKYLITPAVSGTLNAGKYIDAMMGSGFAEKWFGEPVTVTDVLYTFPEYLRIVPLIFLIILIILTLAAVVGAIKPMEFLTVNCDIEDDVIHNNEEEKDMASVTTKFFERLKHYFAGFLGFVQRLSCGKINDYVLWVVSITAIVLVYLFIFV